MTSVNPFGPGRSGVPPTSARSGERNWGDEPGRRPKSGEPPVSARARDRTSFQDAANQIASNTTTLALCQGNLDRDVSEISPPPTCWRGGLSRSHHRLRRRVPGRRPAVLPESCEHRPSGFLFVYSVSSVHRCLVRFRHAGLLTGGGVGGPSAAPEGIRRAHAGCAPHREGIRPAAEPEARGGAHPAAHPSRGVTATR